MSPEQALAKHGLVDHRSDVSGLGATLYELLTLRPAVEGQDKHEVLRRIAFEEPTAPRSLDRTIPVDLETITLKALAKDLETITLKALAKEPADRALRILKTVQQRHPEDFWSCVVLAELFQQSTPPQWEQAIRDHTAAVALRPHSPGARVNLGRALQERGRLVEAIAEYREAIRLKDDYAIPHNNLGNALSALRKWEEAIDCYRRAIKRAPRFATFHVNLGNALDASKKWEQAILCYHEALTINPKLSVAHFNLGLTLHNNEKVEKAIEYYQKAINCNPAYAKAYYNLGVALESQGKVEEAIKCYQMAIQFNYSTNAEAHFQLGCFLRDRGKQDEAITCFRKTLERNPRHVGAFTGFKGHQTVSNLADHVSRSETDKILALDALHEVGTGGAKLGIGGEMIQKRVLIQEYGGPSQQVREDHGPSKGSSSGAMMKRSSSAGSPVQRNRPAVCLALLRVVCTVMVTFSCSWSGNGWTGLRTPFS
jgi:tetratricopeptide (TPR) repeat protein